MRKAALLLLLVTCMASANAQIQSRSEDERAIHQLIVKHWTASQTGDFDGLVGGYRHDSDVRWADGVLLEGLPAIHQRYREVLSRGSRAIAHHHPEDSVRIRFLSKEIAFADIESVPVIIDEESDSKSTATRTPFFVIFTKVDGNWGVAIERQGAVIP